MNLSSVEFVPHGVVLLACSIKTAPTGVGTLRELSLCAGPMRHSVEGAVQRIAAEPSGWVCKLQVRRLREEL